MLYWLAVAIFAFWMLANPVPIPGGVSDVSAPSTTIHTPGVRVAIPSSQDGGSAFSTNAQTKACTKASEVWAMYGYGHVQHQSRIRRIKRSFCRACKRPMIAGHTSYHGRTLWAADVPFRLRSRLTSHTSCTFLFPSTRTLC